MYHILFFIGSTLRLTLAEPALRVLEGLGFAQGRAHASSIEQIGAGSPGIDSMWAQLKQTFPHTDMGSGGLLFVVLMLANIILRFIAGIAVLMVVYGGIRMIMTVADENAHSEAKKIIIYACLGLVLCIGTDAIVIYVQTMVKLAAGG